uniref:Uncharacterized protein n=1 Tax=Oryza meridionalis TaxID=40149 RepID=A0A0E0DT85_9ORYZ
MASRTSRTTYRPFSIGCLPLTSSSITTPKLYTSLFSDSCCVRELAELADAAAQCSLQADARQPPAKTRDIHGTISEEGPSHDIGGRRRRRWL